MKKTIKKLELQNIRILDNKSIDDIAKANQTSPYKIVAILQISKT